MWFKLFTSMCIGRVALNLDKVARDWIAIGKRYFGCQTYLSCSKTS